MSMNPILRFLEHPISRHPLTLILVPAAVFVVTAILATKLFEWLL